MCFNLFVWVGMLAHLIAFRGWKELIYILFSASRTMIEDLGTLSPTM